MIKKHASPAPENNALFTRVCDILESARTNIARTVNTSQVLANWLIGREIVEAEQAGEHRAAYGRQLLKSLSKRLTEAYGRGFSVSSLQYMRSFFLAYPKLLLQEEYTPTDTLDSIQHAVRVKSKHDAVGMLNPSLSWTHYRTLLKVERPQARDFYEIESVKNSWSARELERQINSLMFDRLANSRNKDELLKVRRAAMNCKTIRQKILTTEDTESTEEIQFPLVPTLSRGNRYLGSKNDDYAFPRRSVGTSKSPLVPTLPRGNRYLGSENDDYAFPRRSVGTSKLQNDSALLAQAINEMKL